MLKQATSSSAELLAQCNSRNPYKDAPLGIIKEGVCAAIPGLYSATPSALGTGVGDSDRALRGAPRRTSTALPPVPLPNAKGVPDYSPGLARLRAYPGYRAELLTNPDRGCRMLSLALTSCTVTIHNLVCNEEEEPCHNL
jgi:hypothetical protein